MATMEELFPEYGLRGFNAKGVHRNGTEYDDEGYDIFFKDKDGNIRPDKIPPIDANYLQNLEAAISTALTTAENLCTGKWAWYEEGGEVAFGRLWVMDDSEMLQDIISCTSPKALATTCPWDSNPNYVSYGRIHIYTEDLIGGCSLCMPWGGPISLCVLTIWDERSGRVLVDTHDLPKALAQIGVQILTSVRDLGGLGSVLIVAAMLLMINDYWSEAESRVEGLRSKIEEIGASRWSEWEKQVEREIEYRKRIREREKEEADDSVAYNPDDDIPF